jgi:hypothetical protein
VSADKRFLDLRDPTEASQADAIVPMLYALAAYADQHWTRYESLIGHDGVIGPAWRDALLGVRGLLNGEIGGLDAGWVDATILQMLDVAGFPAP